MKRFSIFILLFSGFFLKSQVILNEIYVISSDEVNSHSEFVELINKGEENVLIDNYRICFYDQDGFVKDCSVLSGLLKPEQSFEILINSPNLDSNFFNINVGVKKCSKIQVLNGKRNVIDEVRIPKTSLGHSLSLIHI